MNGVEAHRLHKDQIPSKDLLFCGLKTYGMLIFGQKRKGKVAGKRKTPKVSLSKLSNKRLNKLAKQGKLKKKLPKGKYINLLKQRTSKSEASTSKTGKHLPVSDISSKD